MWHKCANYINLSGAALALIVGDFAYVYLKTGINKRRKGGADMSLTEMRTELRMELRTTRRAAAGVSDSMSEAPGSGWIALNTRQRCNEASEFEHELFKRIVAQDDAVFALSQIYQVYLAKMTLPNKPLGALLFLGPTGSGKTRSVEAAAEILFGDPYAMVKVDCAEFQHSHEISKLVGS